MGFAKNRGFELADRGFGEIEGSLCLDHVTDACLATRLSEFATQDDCVVCGRACTAGETAPFTVPLEPLIDTVVETLRHFYAEAVQVLPWDNEEHAYVGPQLDTSEAVYDVAGGAFTPAYSDDILELINYAMGDETVWTSWFTDGDMDELDYAWDQFAGIAMHQSRMVVGLGSPTDPPARLGNFLGSTLLYAEAELGLVKPMPVGTPLYRGRLCEDAGSLRRHSDDLGPAPLGKAAANRMSPAGVALFYASADPQTAIAEIAGHGVEPLAVIGKFTNTRELRILDLTATPSPISPFCVDLRQPARMARFLSSFINYITAPVIPDGRQHVEYAPTQLLTEYLRWVPQPKLDGIALPSAQTGERTYVLFFDRSDCATVGDPAAHYGAGFTRLDIGADASPTLVLDPEGVITYRVVRRYEGKDAGLSHRAAPPW